MADPAPDLTALRAAIATLARYEPDGPVEWRAIFADDLAAAVNLIVHAAPALLARCEAAEAEVARLKATLCREGCP
jgi:hypothetical protein